MTPDDQPDSSAVYYDGTSNRKHRVGLRFAERLEIVEDGATIASWPYDDIRRIESHKGLRLSAVSAPPLARLEIADEATAERVRGRCGALDVGNGRPQTARIVGWSLAAACSIVLMVLYGIPFAADRLTPLVPQGLETRLGDAVDKQVRAMLGGKICTRAEGRRALAKLVDKLKEAGGTDAALQVRVLSSAIPNAIALPGGTIYLFQGLLEKARDPDEIAGILGHEIGHAHHRDGLRGLIRSGGSSFLIGLLFGDITGSGAVIFASQSLLDASHSRQAETGADDFAVAALTKMGRSPAPMGEFLVRLTDGEGQAGGRRSTILDSHPVSAMRLERMKGQAGATAGPPLLTTGEWQALKNICN